MRARYVMPLLLSQKRILAACLVGAVLSLLAAPAEGILRKIDLATLVRKSEAIICGEVVSMKCYRSRLLNVGELIFTDVTIEITDRISGYVPDATITIQIPGGTIDGLEMVCPDAPRYEKGEKVLVFLRRFNGCCWNVAWAFGKYTLTTAATPDRGGSLTRVRGRRGAPIEQSVDLEPLRRAIARYLPRPGGSR